MVTAPGFYNWRKGGVTSSGIMKENPSKTSSLKGEGKKTARSQQIAKKFRFQKLNTRAFESHIDREVLVNRNPPKTVMLASRTIRKGVMTPSDMSISWGVCPLLTLLHWHILYRNLLERGQVPPSHAPPASPWTPNGSTLRHTNSSNNKKHRRHDWHTTAREGEGARF